MTSLTVVSMLKQFYEMFYKPSTTPIHTPRYAIHLGYTVLST